jgi:MFS family permease
VVARAGAAEGNGALSISSSVPSPRVARDSWTMLGCAFVTFSASAALLHAYTVFLVAFIDEFRWTRADTSLAYAVSQLVSGFSAPLVGILVDRLGQRRMVLIGGGLLTIGLVATAQITALWQLILLYGVVMTLGANCLGLLVFVPLLSRLFERRRGMAISILQSGNGGARAVSAPAAQFAIDAIGWRSTLLAEAGLLAVLLVPLTIAFRRAERRDRRPEPAPRAAEAPPPHLVTRPWTLAEAMRTPHFWLLFVVYLCTGLGSFFVSLHQLAFAVDQGFDKLYAAEVLGLGSLLAIVGVIATGTLSDYIGREWSAILAYIISIVGVICALFIDGPDQHLLLWLHACLFGITWGARGPAVTAKTADLFPGPHLGAILGVITIGTGLGSAIGAWGAGWIFDVSGSYRLAFILSIVSYLIGCIAFWALRRPPATRRA